MVDIIYLLQSGEVNHSTTLVNTCFSIHIVSHRNQIKKKKVYSVNTPKKGSK